MPTTRPADVGRPQAADDLKARDAMLRSFPEVWQVVGKAGRAETPTDPSPLDMIETIINLRDRDALAQAEAQVRGRRWPRPSVVLDGLEAQG